MKLRSLAAALGAGVLAFSANTAFATDVPAVAPAQVPVSAGPTLVSVFGTGITLSVGTDAAGHLTSVDLTGSATTGAVATEVSPHEVRFVVADGSTQIEVKAKGKSVKTEVTTRDLAGLLGEHTWSGELFGIPGGQTAVVFTIGDSGGGVPTIALNSVIGPGSGTQILTPSASSDDDESEAKLRIELNDGAGHEARITIKVEVEDHDGHVEAELKVSARSDLFAVEEAVGSVADPVVNVPVVEQHHDDDDHDSDHDDDHDSDDDDHDDDHDSHDDDHDSHEGDHDSHDD